MANEIVGSHLKANNSYGQNGSPLPSSLNPGKSKPNIADVSPPTANVPGLDAADQLGARVHMTADGKPMGYPTSDGLSARTVDSGSPGGSIPAATIRRDSGKRLLK
jgi:hypothetical protein